MKHYYDITSAIETLAHYYVKDDVDDILFSLRKHFISFHHYHFHFHYATSRERWHFIAYDILRRHFIAPTYAAADVRGFEADYRHLRNIIDYHRDVKNIDDVFLQRGFSFDISRRCESRKRISRDEMWYYHFRASHYVRCATPHYDVQSRVKHFQRGETLSYEIPPPPTFREISLINITIIIFTDIFETEAAADIDTRTRRAFDDIYARTLMHRALLR